MRSVDGMMLAWNASSPARLVTPSRKSSTLAADIALASACTVGLWVQMATSSSGRPYGSGASSTALTNVKMAAVTPVPRASISSAVAVNAGWRRKPRAAYRTSCTIDSSRGRPLPSRRASTSAGMLPTASRARRSASSDGRPARRCSAAWISIRLSISAANSSSSRVRFVTDRSFDVKTRHALMTALRRPRGSGP